MKKSSLLLGLLIGLSSIILGQTQISFFNNQVPALELNRNGLVNIDGEDYLIEADDYNFRVSSIKDSIRLLYEVSDYPFDQNIHHVGGSLNTRSGFIIEGEFLYELFYGLIRKRNILTSEIVAEYPCPFIDLNYQSKVEVIDGIIYMQVNRLRDLAFYNTITEEYILLPYDPKLTCRSGSNYYTKSSVNGIIEYNAKDNLTNFLFQSEENTIFGNNCTINGQKGVIFGGSDQTRFLNADTTFLLSCTFDSNIAPELNIHESDDHYIALYNDVDASTIKIINKDDCTDYSVETVELGAYEQNIRILEPEILNGNFLIIEINDDDDIPATVFLLDKTELSLTQVDDGKIGYISDSKFYRSGDEVYFAGHDDHQIYTQWNLYSINLLTKEFKLNLEEHSYELPILFGPSETDSTLLIPRNGNNRTDVFKFFNSANSSLISRTANTRNAGITSIEFLAFDEKRLAFKFNKGIYYADNNNSSTDKITKITEGDNSSKFVIKDDKIKGLINNNGNTFRISTDLITHQLTTGNLQDFVPLDKKTIAFSNFVFAESLLSDKKYFDLQSSDFVEIPITGDIESMHRSNNHMIFLSSCASGYCLTSFKDGIFSELEKNFQNEPQIFSKGNGEFMAFENITADNNRLSIIKSDGSLGDEINVIGVLRFNDYESIETGPLSALMFYNSGTENLEIIMHRYDKFHRHTVPFIHGLVAPILWYKAGNSIIIQSDDNNEPGIYLATLGKETKKLELNDVGDNNYSLQFASYENEILSFYVHSYLNGLEIVHYDIESESLQFTSDNTNQLVFDPYFQNPIFRISPTEHYVTFTNSYESENFEYSELYIFDASTPSLDAQPDLNQNSQSSNPHRFIDSPSYLYFIARSPLDNSYQLFSKQKAGITAVKNSIKSPTKVKVHPNPSADAISIDSNADIVHFKNVKGQIVKDIRKHDKNQRIDISNLKSGIYFLEIRYGNEVSTSSFIKY